MEEAFIQNALAYASEYHLQFAERLGFGIHGIIFVAEDKSAGGKTAVKAHRETEPYLREHAVYERLKQAGVTNILGFNVPQLIRADDRLRIIEMSIVTRPFVLDFAGAYLDAPPDFTDEIQALDVEHPFDLLRAVKPGAGWSDGAFAAMPLPSLPSNASAHVRRRSGTR
jgi:hypothetical protein